MFYFLIILIPFIAAMAWLVNQNKKLKAKYLEVEKVLYGIRQDSGHHVAFPKGINRDLVVTENAIKRLEAFLEAYEEKYGQTAKSISNIYATKAEKLKVLADRAKKLKSLIRQPSPQHS